MLWQYLKDIVLMEMLKKETNIYQACYKQEVVYLVFSTC